MRTPVAVELFYSNAWHDITSRVYVRDGIHITRGRPDEVQRIPPSTLSLTLDNRNGVYSPRNPNSALYGLIGRNTPIRVSITGYDVVADTFSRDSTGWGTSEYAALAWSDTGSGGTINPLFFPVSGGTAQHLIDATNAYKFSWLPDVSLADVTTTCKFKFLDNASSDVTGADVEPANMMLRVQDVNNYYMCRVELHADQTVTASLHVVGGAGSIGSATVSGLTYSGQWLRVKGQAVGTTIRMRVWEDEDAEPSTWDVTATDSAITAAGAVGIRSGVATGNTNISPTFYYDDFTIDTAYRFHGEVESWPQRWSVDGNDAWAPITANGIMRRLTAPGTTVLARSAMRRLLDQSTPVAYWALDDGQLSTAGALTSGAGSAMTISSSLGDTKFGSSALSPWLESGIAIDVDVTVTGLVTGMSATPTTMAVDWIRQATEGQTLVDIVGSHINSGMRWKLYFTAGAFNDIELYVYNNGTQVDYQGELGVPQYFDSRSHHVHVTASQSGSNVVWNVYVDGTSILSATINSMTLTGVQQVEISQVTSGTSTGPVTIGHFSVWDSSIDFATLASAAAGFTGESAIARIQRMCTEEGITLTTLGTVSEAVGVQRIVPPLDVMLDAADVDVGILYEPRTYLGLVYRTGESLYNQPATVALNYSAGGEVAPPLEPVEDSDATTNDVTVTRYLGGSANAVRETGPLNVQEPSDDPNGVGRYRKEYTLVLSTDDQCPDQASWRRHIGTWDEARYPVVNMDLTAMNVESKAALISQAASLDVGGRFTIASPPAWLPPETIEQHAQGFSETLASHLWTIAANATPALPYEIYTIGTETTNNRSRIPAARGQSTLNEALDTTETGVDVISVRKPWIDSAAFSSQFPFDVMIGGERMTVTACAGTGLTQTFTVTRSVNGIVKSHASGTEVQLFHPSVLAL